jgi:TM2 domain-containing membrane protein YozV
MKRSAALTKGHRWKVFGLLLLLILVSLIVAGLLQLVLMQVGSTILVLLGTLLWGALWTAFYSIAVVTTYHDLRVAKEGIDIEQIASVFD